MEDYAIGYLDILGFRNYVSRDIDAATDMIAAFQAQVDLKRGRDEPRGHYSPKWKEVIDKWEVGSFDYYLPFSDSVCILSKDPDLFVRQLSTFVLDSYLYQAHHVTDPNQRRPEEVTITLPCGDDTNNPTPMFKTQHRFPLLFRGGVSFGQIRIARQGTIEDGVNGMNVTIVGSAFVNAVRLQSRAGRGPFLVCDKSFYDRLRCEFKHFVIQRDQDYSILYPTIRYYGEPDSHVALNNMAEIFDPAAIYWRAYNHTEYSDYYWSLLRLVSKSTMAYFTSKGMEKEAAEQIRKRVEYCRIDDKLPELLET